jgi:hypothetical protein
MFPQAFNGGPRPPVRIALETRLIDRSEDLDIATFKVTKPELSQLRASTLTIWPPVIPEVNGSVAFAGFPGNDRSLVAPYELSFALCAGLMIANSVNQRSISCRFDREFLVETRGFPAPPPNYDIGGVSGGPLLTLVERNGLQYLALGGVISQGSSELELFFASRADCILEDGTLSRI